jgi:hypothetical protein
MSRFTHVQRKDKEMNELEVKDLGKCYRNKDGFALYKDGAGFIVYSIFKEEGKEFANFRGYLTDPDNFESVVEDLKYEDKLALHELEKEFGVYFG